MANDKLTLRITDFAGINERDEATAIEDNQAIVAQNGYVDRGTFRKRKGYITVGDDVGNDKILGLHGYYKVDGTKELLMAAGSTIYKLVGSTWTSIKTGLTADTPMYFETAANVVYMSNGVDNVQVYDGSSVTENTVIPKGTILTYYKNMLIVAGITTEPARLYYSFKGVETTLETGVPTVDFDVVNDYIDVNANDGEAIVAIKPLFDQLVIFKERSVWSLLGSNPANFQLVNRNSPVGSISQRSVQRTIKGLMFLANDGQVYLYQDLVDPIPVSYPIPVTMAGINLDNSNIAAAGYYDNKYRLAVPNGSNSYNNLVLIYDELRDAWTTQTGVNASCWLTYRSGVKDELYFGEANTDSLVYKAENGTNDNGAAIDMEWQSKEFTVGVSERDKSFRSLYIFAQQQGDWDIEISDNKENYGYNKIGDFNLLGNNKALGVTWTMGVDPLGSQGKLFKKFDLVGPAIKAYQVKYKNNAVDQPVEINEFQLKFNVENTR